MDGQTDVRHTNSIGGLVTRNPPNKRRNNLKALIEDIENSKDDARRMFKALNIIQGKLKKENILIKKMT